MCKGPLKYEEFSSKGWKLGGIKMPQNWWCREGEREVNQGRSWEGEWCFRAFLGAG